MDIKAIGAINRRVQEIIFADNTKAYRANTTQNPLYYLTPAGVYTPVDITSKVISKTSKDEDMCLRAQSITSVGFKVTDDAYKYMGLRPDCVQDGSEQLEFSIVKIELDGKSQSVNLSSNTALSDTITEIGPLVYVQSTRQRTRQMVRVNDPISTFTIVYQIDATGLELVVQKEIDEFWFYSKRTGDFRFRIGHPRLVGMDGDSHPMRDAVAHTLQDNGDGTYTYIKTNTLDLSGIKTPYFIDADTAYSTTADGYVTYTGADSDSFAVVRAAGAGTKSSGDSSHNEAMMTGYPEAFKFKITRSFFYFDLAALSGVALSANISLRGYSVGNNTVCVQQGTQSDALANGDYDAFSGNSWGNTAAWSTSGYNDIALDATGMGVVSSSLGGILKVCAREYPHDYSNSTPGTNTYQNGCYYAEQTNTTSDPKIVIVLSPTNAKTLNSLSASLIKNLNDLAFASVKTLNR